jgi:hypothetical protein
MVMDYVKVDGFVCTAMTAFHDIEISRGQAKQSHQQPLPGYCIESPSIKVGMVQRQQTSSTEHIYISLCLTSPSFILYLPCILRGTTNTKIAVATLQLLLQCCVA